LVPLAALPLVWPFDSAALQVAHMIAIEVVRLVCRLCDGRRKLFEGRVPSRVTQVLPMTKRRSRAPRSATMALGLPLTFGVLRSRSERCISHISPQIIDEQPRQNYTALIFWYMTVRRSIGYCKAAARDRKLLQVLQSNGCDSLAALVQLIKADTRHERPASPRADKSVSKQPIT
jgi:hypothetical protein